MIPSGSHKWNWDWTVFTLYKKKEEKEDNVLVDWEIIEQEVSNNSFTQMYEDNPIRVLTVIWSKGKIKTKKNKKKQKKNKKKNNKKNKINK